ncbi:hypothetical protein Psuf_060020 [Phytohabitans suffuscus]|uniref:Uncharacterized protein n=1 Tax=Phytohabitans suffuscus TaxID=624315 RepID=A0A6F8YRK3_9ACTN|nr:hypothetical protein Psuf_060020 [Phytohabitans suffuscus]
MPAHHAERWIERELNKALHVGTHEAAIENILRRVSVEHEDPAAFYLHRVAIKVHPHRVNGGCRDENHEAAAQLTTMDLRAVRAEGRGLGR